MSRPEPGFPIGALLASAAWLCAPVSLVPQAVPTALASTIERRLADGDETSAGPATVVFYRGRGFRPIWLEAEGRGGRVRALLAALDAAESDGLRAAHYGSAELASRVESSTSAPVDRADLELRLTGAFLRYATDLALGRTDPGRLAGEWSNEREPFDSVTALRRAVEAGVAVALDELRPVHRQYRALRAVLARLREMPEWGRIRAGEDLERGDVDPRVSAIRVRLRASQDLPDPESHLADPDVFDADLEEGVRRFQARHGLRVDGLVGRATLDAMNVSLGERIRQVEANLERWRWLPRDLGSRRVIVNVPGFSVTLESAAGTISRHRAIVGRTDRETPTFSSAIESFALAPYWNVPPTLARRDILPKIRASLDYLAEQRIRVLDGTSGAAVDPASIDWTSISDREFLARYRLRQEPGPLNALGNVKLIFPNPYTVFLHDTAARARFEDNPRALSSGCIRVERPLEILEWLLAGDPEWPSMRIHDVIDGGDELYGRIEAPVPIHVLYLTAVVEEDGRPGFRPDLYGLDRALLRALEGTTRIEDRQPGILFESCS